MKRIEVPFSNKKIVVQQEWCDIPEVFISIEDVNGVWQQDLASVRVSFTLDENFCPVIDDSKYDVFVYDTYDSGSKKYTIGASNE